MIQRRRKGGSHRGIRGLWAALALVGLSAWSLQTGSVQGQGFTTFTTSTTSHSTHTRVDSFSPGSRAALVAAAALQVITIVGPTS